MPKPLNKAIIAGLFAVLVVAFSSETAMAQGVCDQYPNAPGCEVGPIEGGGNGGDLGPEGGGGGNGTGNLGDGDGSLPFTGYPATPLVLLVLALLMAGITLRAYSVWRSRRGSVSA